MKNHMPTHMPTTCPCAPGVGRRLLGGHTEGREGRWCACMLGACWVHARCMLLHAHACSCMLMHARACSCMLIHARACSCMLVHARGLGPRRGGVPPGGVPEAHLFLFLVSRRPRAEATCERAGGAGRARSPWGHGHGGIGAWGHGSMGARGRGGIVVHVHLGVGVHVGVHVHVTCA